MTLRVAFLGTGRLAGPVFQALCDSSHTVCGLVTQPDRTGPGHHRHRNPLKELALERGIPVQQPVRIKTPESVAALRSLDAELFVVAAYGQILSREILDMPRLGTINVHASLLPRHRGATPIHAAILRGDLETGVTIIQLVPELDAGPMLGTVSTPIGRKETTGELESRLAELAPPLTLDVIAQLAAGAAKTIDQDPALVTHVGKLSKADGRIDWAQSAAQIDRHVRGMQPWPGPFTTLLQTDKPPLRMQILDVEPTFNDSQASPGTIVAVSSDMFLVKSADAAVQVLRIHPDGKRPLPTAEFLRGRRVQIGDRCE
ncbi:MAG: methionyl-tRNA formyltransferase [Planctomycetales bacterium 12-60-4]|nr:MAG: methionyl-tRNA formyltransferase [Planctomycetales bacterium 12-60-4]